MIEVINLTKTYSIDGHMMKVVDDVSFVINKGDMASIVGHSGSGKTTLLSLIGGLTRPDSGSIIINGTDIWKLSDDAISELRNRRIGFIYQFSSLVPTLTALENILLPTVFGTHDNRVEEYALSLLDTVGLKDKINAYPSQLSGGQQRRIAIARAFINRPEIILADEPTGDLDEETEVEMMHFFRRMNRENHITFIMVTHNNDLALQTDRRLRMVSGSIHEMH